MNMIMHDVHYRKFDIKNEDTLEHPQHIDKRFEAVVANPPFSADWSASQLFMNDDRFGSYGKLAPTSKADFAFVQHMVFQLDDNGTMACVLPHGVLFRGAAEGHIRKHLIEDKNYLDAVIGLPANVFYGTSIPTCILVLKKKRKHADNILFIDAIPDEFEKYWHEQKVLALGRICEEEHLDQPQFQALIDAYIYSEQEPTREDVFKCLDDRPSVLQAREIGERIIVKMKEFVEVFVRGVAA